MANRTGVGLNGSGQANLLPWRMSQRAAELGKNSRWREKIGIGMTQIGYGAPWRRLGHCLGAARQSQLGLTQARSICRVCASGTELAKPTG